MNYTNLLMKRERKISAKYKGGGLVRLLKKDLIPSVPDMVGVYIIFAASVLAVLIYTLYIRDVGK